MNEAIIRLIMRTNPQTTIDVTQEECDHLIRIGLVRIEPKGPRRQLIEQLAKFHAKRAQHSKEMKPLPQSETV